MKNIRKYMKSLLELLFGEVETPEEIQYITDVEIQERLNYIRKLSKNIERYKHKIAIENQYLEDRIQEKLNYEKEKNLEDAAKDHIRLIS